MPVAYRIVVEQKRRCDSLAAPSFIEKNKRIRPARKPVLRRSVPSELDQVTFCFSIEKSSANHSSIGIRAAVPRKEIFGYLKSRSIHCAAPLKNLKRISNIFPLRAEPERHIAILACGNKNVYTRPSFLALTNDASASEKNLSFGAILAASA
jgi:hypothetical protein